MILMNLIKFFIVFQYFTNIEAKESNIIKDRLYWCSSIDPKVTPFLDINSEWNKDHNRIKIIIRTCVNFLGVKYRRLTHYAVNMGNEECRDMVIDHNCGATRNETMKCEEEECFFERIPEDKYKWMQEINMEGIRCKLRPRIVKGVKKDSIVFGHNCKASDRYCKMDKSMIVWEHQKKDECPFTLITMVELKKARNGVLYDTKNKLAFRTTKKVEHCALTMLLTTENLYIVLNQNTLNQISVLTKISKLKRSGSGELNALDLSVSHELLMSKSDGADFALSQEIIENQRQNCLTMGLHFNYLKSNSRKYEVSFDSHGVERVFYSDYGMIFMPTCMVIEEFKLSEINVRNSYCIDEPEISFKIKNITQHGYVTSNRIIVNEPTISKNCDLKMMYFSKAKRMVLSQNNKNEVVKANHAFSIDDFFSQREINFPHYTQLLKSAEVIGVLKNSHHIWQYEDNTLEKINLNHVKKIDRLVENARLVQTKITDGVDGIITKSTGFVKSIIGDTIGFIEGLMILIGIILIFGIIFIIFYVVINTKKAFKRRNSILVETTREPGTERDRNVRGSLLRTIRDYN